MGVARAQEFALGGDCIEGDDALIEVEVWVRPQAGCALRPDPFILRAPP
jgi:hypothetical protein